MLESKCSVIEACSYLNVVEFCQFESASNLLAFGSVDSLCISCLILHPNIGLNRSSNAQSVHLSHKSLDKYEVLATFDYKGVSCISWSPASNMRHLPRCAKLAFGMHNGIVCILTTDFKEDPKAVTLKGHKKAINSVSFEPTTGSRLASVSDDHTCIIWNVEDGEVLATVRLMFAGMNVCWNVLEPGKLMVGEQGGRVRFYDLDDVDGCINAQPILCLESDNGSLASCHWCPTNPLRVGACIGNEWVVWNISNSLLPEETRQAHSLGCNFFRWSNHNEDVFVTQGKPKCTTKFHHLGHRELLFNDINVAGSGASWHISLPICAVAANRQIKVYNLDSLTSS